MTKRIGLQLGFAGSPQERVDIVERVRVADDLGVESVWAAEAWGRDAFSILTQLALTTKNIKLGTAIVNVFSRTPAVLAMTFGTLDELSGGRAIIGLGSSGANVTEHWHGVKFEKPATRLREYIEIINMIMRQKRLMYDGQIFKLERGFTMQFPTVRDHIPTFIASITPKSMVQTGEIADGMDCRRAVPDCRCKKAGLPAQEICRVSLGKRAWWTKRHQPHADPDFL